MSSPFREDPKKLKLAARKFIAAIRRGAEIADAASHAGVSPGEARGWLRDEPQVREAYDRARQGKGAPRVIALGQLLSDEEKLELAWARMERLNVGGDLSGHRFS